MNASTPLTKAIVEATELAWRTLKSRYADETFYGFALFTNHEMTYISCTAWTEEGLQEVAEDYEIGSLSELNTIRFSPADSPIFEEGSEAFPNLVDPLLADLQDLNDAEAEDAIATQLDACVAALRRVEADGLFAAEARDRFVLNIMMVDQSANSIVDNAKLLNPKPTIDWFEPFFETSNDSQVAAMIGDARVYMAREIALTGDLVVVSDENRRIHVFTQSSPASFEQQACKELSERRALCMTFDRLGKHLWVGAEEQLLRIPVTDRTHLGTPELVWTDPGAEYIRSVVLSPNGELLTLVLPREIRVHEAGSGRALWSAFHAETRGEARFNEATGELLYLNETGVHWVEPSTGARLRSVSIRSDAHAAAIAENGASVAISFGPAHYDESGSQKELTVFDAISGDSLWAATETATWPMSPIAFSPSGRRCAAGVGGEVVVFNDRGSVIFRALSKLESVSDVAWTSEEVIIVAGQDVDKGPPARAFRIDEP